jgi:hypothetical protein
VVRGEKCGSWAGIYGQQLSAPLAVCSQLQLVAVCSVMARYTLEQHVFLCDTQVKYRSAREYRREFRRKFRDEGVPSGRRIHKLANKIRSTGFLMHKKQKHTRRVLTEEKLGDRSQT